MTNPVPDGRQCTAEYSGKGSGPPFIFPGLFFFIGHTIQMEKQITDIDENPRFFSIALCMNLLHQMKYFRLDNRKIPLCCCDTHTASFPLHAEPDNNNPLTSAANADNIPH